VKQASQQRFQCRSRFQWHNPGLYGQQQTKVDVTTRLPWSGRYPSSRLGNCDNRTFQ